VGSTAAATPSRASLGTRVDAVLRGEQQELAWWAVIAAAIVLRVAWSAWIAHAHPSAVTSGDTSGYIGPARALLEKGRFSLSPQDPTPMFLRTPGYPAFLAAILWVTDSRWSISAIQATLSVSAVLVTVFVGRRVIGPTAAMLAGVLVALDPLQFALSGTILTETLATLMLVSIVAFGVVVFVRRPEEVKVRHFFVLGASLAAATMVRPTTYYFPPIVVILLLWRFRRLGWRRLIVSLLAFVLPIVVVVGGWELRNHYAVDSWQLSGSAAVTIYCYNAAAVEAKVTGRSVHATRVELGCHPGGWDDLAASCPSWWGCNVPHRLANGRGFDEMNSRGFHIVTRHPFQSAEIVLAGLGRETFGPGTDTVSRFLHVRSSFLLAAPLFLWNLVVWSLALLGTIVALRSPLRAFWVFLISVLLYVLLLSAGAESSARFRTPLVPLLALLAAVGAKHVVRSLREEHGRTEKAVSPERD
jgi:4-amino-4-deoxy-L-arabinose transferase-like glycosyltransferase